MDIERSPGRKMYALRKWEANSNQCWADADMAAMVTLYSYPSIREVMPPILKSICGKICTALCRREWDVGKNTETF